MGAAAVFGYGSLAVGDRPFVLEGYRRRWGVALDNSVDLPATSTSFIR